MLVRFLALPFFIVYLGLSIFPSVLALTWAKLNTYKPLLLALVLLGLTFIISVTQLSSTPPPTPLSPTEAAQYYFESLLEKQPTHRDVLLNLSKINKTLGNDEQAQEYRDRAQELDPNNPLFTQENK
jgi:tetratricopeptide (TPR) repeat protein